MRALAVSSSSSRNPRVRHHVLDTIEKPQGQAMRCVIMYGMVASRKLPTLALSLAGPAEGAILYPPIDMAVKLLRAWVREDQDVGDAA